MTSTTLLGQQIQIEKVQKMHKATGSQILLPNTEQFVTEYLGQILTVNCNLKLYITISGYYILQYETKCNCIWKHFPLRSIH